ncbi:hypothetical protein EON65_21575 [archaeon]|nr:MAG: hypothetical protein EON65_21575 [archaeon]
MWRTYLEELLVALTVNVNAFHLSTAILPSDPSIYAAHEPMTHFEKKYMIAKVPIYEVITDLGKRGESERSSLINSLMNDHQAESVL